MSYNDNEVLWVERYRPRKLDDCILPDALKEKFRGYVNADVLQNLLLTGAAGMGKTTVAKVLAEEMDMDVMFIDGSNEGRLIDTLRTKITQFASTVSYNGKRKIVLLDEADMLPETIQTALRGFIELYANNCAFIFTCNFEHKIFEPLRQSRLVQIDFKFTPEDKPALCVQFYKRLSTILTENNIPFDPPALVGVIQRDYPDWRRLINSVQEYASHKGTIDAGILTAVGHSDIKELIGYLKTKNFREMRKWVPRNNPSMATLVSHIYTEAYDLIDLKSIPDCVMLLNEYQTKHATALIPEINIVAMLTVLMTNIEWR